MGACPIFYSKTHNYSRFRNYLDTRIVVRTMKLRLTLAQANSLCYKCKHIFGFYYNWTSRMGEVKNLDSGEQGIESRRG